MLGSLAPPGLDTVSEESGSSSGKAALFEEWQKYCAENGISETSKSRFKRWKTETQEKVLAEGFVGEWGKTILRASKVVSKIEKDAAAFKAQPLFRGPVGVRNQGEGKKGQGFEQTAVHFAITKVPGAIVAQQVLCQSGQTEFITVETWKTAREQMNPTAVVTQGKATIGMFELLTDQKVKASYKTFISSAANKKYFGCSIAPTLSSKQVPRLKCIGDECYYDYNTTNQHFPFPNGDFSFGAGTDFGVPNTKDESNIIKEVSCMTCWLCNLPLVKQSPMKKGKPDGKPEPPHTEHVLNILDALFYLDLFETKDTQLMIDYNCYLEETYYDKEGWGVAPSREGFLAYINALRKTSFSADDLTVYPGITSLNEAWLKIHDFKLEYLYAHPDCNYEKNDDSLLCVNDKDTNLVFNEAMANDLAERIWTNRLIKTGGLLDVLDLATFKTTGKNQWKKNVLRAWRQRLGPTADYINTKRGVQRGEESFYGFMTLGAYICRLPNTIKEVMTNHTSTEFDGQLSLEEKNIPLVPTDEMILTLLHMFSYQVGNLAAKHGKTLTEFTQFCGLDATKRREIEAASTNVSVPSGRMTRGERENAAKLLQKQLQIVAFNKLFEKGAEYLNYIINTFSKLFYSLREAEQTESNRNAIISLVIAKVYVSFIEEFHPLAERETDGPFKTELKQYLETEKSVKEIKIQEIIASSGLSITAESLRDTRESAGAFEGEYKADADKYKALYNEDSMNTVATFNPIQEVISFEFEDASIPKEMKGPAQTVFSAAEQGREARVSEQAEIVKILELLKNSNETTDDIIVLDDDYDSDDEIQEEESPVYRLREIKGQEKPPVRMSMLGITAASTPTGDRELSRGQFFDDYSEENGNKQFLVLKKTGNEILTANQIAKQLIGKDKHIQSIRIHGAPLEMVEAQSLKKRGGRKTRRHKKTRKYNKKRVSRKYIL